jgi:hypothetical protein
MFSALHIFDSKKQLFDARRLLEMFDLLISCKSTRSYDAIGKKLIALRLSLPIEFTMRLHITQRIY